MLRPKYPTNPIPGHTAETDLARVPVVLTPTVIESSHPAQCGCQHTAVAPPPPARRITPTSAAVAAVGGTAVVLVVGAVLVSMLLTVAITACAITGCLIVLRSLVGTGPRDYR